MYRAWLQSLTLLVAVAGAGGLLTPAAALAFHSGAQFDDLPGKGGAGGLFYTGAPSDKGWTCTACHIGAAGKISIQLGSTPLALLQSGSYTPGQAYVLKVGMLGEHLGQAASRSNFNGFALTIRDSQRRPAGNISGFAPEDFYQANPSTIITSGKVVGTSAWTFTWTAPAAGTGAVTLYLGMVDGNGANSSPNVTLTDPFGDDVAVGQLILKDSSVSGQLGVPRGPVPAAQYSSVGQSGRHVLGPLLGRAPLSLGGTYEDVYTRTPWTLVVGRDSRPGAATGLQQRHAGRRSVPGRNLYRHSRWGQRRLR